MEHTSIIKYVFEFYCVGQTKMKNDARTIFSHDMHNLYEYSIGSRNVVFSGIIM